MSSLKSMISTCSLLVLASGSGAAQTTHYVDVNNTPPGTGTQADPFTEIQAALDAPGTLPGDTISVAPGSYHEDIVFHKEDLDLISETGPSTTRIVAATINSSSVRLSSHSRLEGFTLQGAGQGTPQSGGSPAGSGVYVFVSTDFPTISNCIIRDYTTGIINQWDLIVESTTVVFNLRGVHHQEGLPIGTDANTFMTNCITWGNGTNVYGLFGGEVGFNSEYGLDTDPKFWSTINLHLQRTSPAIDAGSPAFPLDEDGTLSDIGALTFDLNYPKGESYCSAAANSTGERGVMFLAGSSSLMQNDLVLSALEVPPNSVGLFFMGTTSTYAPLGNGFLCVGPPIDRLGTVTSGLDGVSTLAFDNTASGSGLPGILAGETRYFQNWFRDVPAAGSMFNFTNGVSVRFQL